MEKELAYKSITPHLKTLRAFGFYQIDPNSSPFMKLLHRSYMTFVLLVNVIYTGQEIMQVFQMRDDAEKVMDTMFLLLTYSDSIYKQVIMWKEQNKIEELLNILKGPLFNQNEPNHRMLLLNRTRQSRLLLRAFNLTALSTCLLWVLYPMIVYVQRKPVEFAIWLPFDPNMSPQIYLVLGYIWIQTSMLAVGNTSMDSLISFFFAQSKTQLSIVRYNLENIVTKCQNESKETCVQFSQVFSEQFRKILQHYNEIIELCSRTQEIFGGAILYLFLVSGWILCTSAYRMVNINPSSVEFSSMILYMTCIIAEIFLYCFYGNEVTYESEKLMESAFAMDWYKIPLEHRYSVILFMERIKRPVKPMAGAFVSLSNTTFVSILRSSYSFYAFLNNTDK